MVLKVTQVNDKGKRKVIVSLCLVIRNIQNDKRKAKNLQLPNPNSKARKKKKKNLLFPTQMN